MIKTKQGDKVTIAEIESFVANLTDTDRTNIVAMATYAIMPPGSPILEAVVRMLLAAHSIAPKIEQE